MEASAVTMLAPSIIRPQGAPSIHGKKSPCGRIDHAVPRDGKEGVSVRVRQGREVCHVARDRSRLHQASVPGLLGRNLNLVAHGVDHRLVNSRIDAGRRPTPLGVGNGSLK
jgi:hypothetical protein